MWLNILTPYEPKMLSKKEINDLENGTELLITWWNRKKPAYYTLVKLHGSSWVVPSTSSNGLTIRPTPLDLIPVTINDVKKETVVRLSDRPFLRPMNIMSNFLVK